MVEAESIVEKEILRKKMMIWKKKKRVNVVVFIFFIFILIIRVNT